MALIKDSYTIPSNLMKDQNWNPRFKKTESKKHKSKIKISQPEGTIQKKNDPRTKIQIQDPDHKCVRVEDGQKTQQMNQNIKK